MKMIIAPTMAEAEQERIRLGLPRTECRMASTEYCLRGHALRSDDVVIVGRERLRADVLRGLELSLRAGVGV